MSDCFFLTTGGAREKTASTGAETERSLLLPRPRKEDFFLRDGRAAALSDASEGSWMLWLRWATGLEGASCWWEVR